MFHYFCRMKNKMNLFKYVLIIVCFIEFMIITYITSIKSLPIELDRDSIYLSSNNNYNKSQREKFTFDADEYVFKISQNTPSEVNLINLNKTYQGFMDKTYDSQCGIPQNHLEFFNLMKSWIELAGKYDLPWWITYGSLFGSLRNEDMVPWDKEIDIGIPSQFEILIRNISTPRSDISTDKINIITRPGQHCPFNGERMNCQGDLVNTQVDVCSFCNCLARAFLLPNVKINIHLYQIVFRDNEIKIFDESLLRQTKKSTYYPINFIFPLQNCQFMGLQITCPVHTEEVLTEQYGHYMMHYKCVDKTWVKIQDLKWKANSNRIK